MTRVLEQGDVLLFEEEIPRSARQRVATNVLAEGESTGHAHRLDWSMGFGPMQDAAIEVEAPKFEVFRDPESNITYLKVIKPVMLRHEEHGAIEVTPGEYRIGIVREKDMFDDMVREVVD